MISSCKVEKDQLEWLFASIEIFYSIITYPYNFDYDSSIDMSYHDTIRTHYASTYQSKNPDPWYILA